MTTGHEWNGIKELNTPVPRTVFFFLIVTFVFSAGYWLLMPAWPLGLTYTKGLLGINQHSDVNASLKQAAASKAGWIDKIATMPVETIRADASLMRIVRETARPLFGDNCAACHGSEAQGGPGFPKLTDNDWLWGGDAETIMETLRVGINSTHAETRVSEMLAFGEQGMLDRASIQDVTAYVKSLSARRDTPDKIAGVAKGKEIFAQHCASCHGENGTGNIELGAPNLADDVWLYGGDKQSIHTTIYNGRQGTMPYWEGRLTSTDRKILTLYILERESKNP